MANFDLRNQFPRNDRKRSAKRLFEVRTPSFQSLAFKLTSSRRVFTRTKFFVRSKLWTPKSFKPRTLQNLNHKMSNPFESYAGEAPAKHKRRCWSFSLIKNRHPDGADQLEADKINLFPCADVRPNVRSPNIVHFRSSLFIFDRSDRTPKNSSPNQRTGLSY